MFAVVKCLFPLVCSVDELVQYNDVTRVDVFPQRATCRRGDDVCTSLLPEGVNVGTVVDQAWHVLVLPTVSARVWRER